MSAAPFDPTSDYIPAGDQQTSNTAPGPVGVMAPDQQPAAAPQPATTPNYPPSPDQGGPVPQSSPDPDAGSNTHGWRAVLRGALSGLENHLEGAGKGLISGGIPGAIVGAVNPAMADNALAARTAVQNARVQQAQAQAKTAMADANYAPQNHDLQLATAQIHLQQLQTAFDSMPKDFQDHLMQEGAEAGQHLLDSGITPTYNGSEEDAQAHVRALMSVNSDKPLNVVALPDGSGNFNVFELPNADKPYDRDVTLTIGHNPDGAPITKTYAAGTISIARGLALKTAAMVDQSKEAAAVAAKVAVSNRTGESAKNFAIAAAASPSTPTTDSLGVAITPPAGGAKATTKLQGQFKKDADDLSKTESTYDMFQDALSDVNSGKDITGAKSVTTLFAAIGLSATPLKGMGMRINQNTVAEHIGARDVGQSLYAQLLRVKDGDIITPQQIKDYASIATVARQSAYVNKINEARSYGLDPSFLLPAGNGRQVDPSTAQIFVAAANGNKDVARKAAQAKGWRF